METGFKKLKIASRSFRKSPTLIFRKQEIRRTMLGFYLRNTFIMLNGPLLVCLRNCKQTSLNVSKSCVLNAAKPIFKFCKT